MLGTRPDEEAQFQGCLIAQVRTVTTPGAQWCTTRWIRNATNSLLLCWERGCRAIAQFGLPVCPCATWRDLGSPLFGLAFHCIAHKPLARHALRINERHMLCFVRSLPLCGLAQAWKQCSRGLPPPSDSHAARTVVVPKHKHFTRMAEAATAECANTQQSSLVLQALELQSVPDRVLTLQHLTQLNLSRNAIQELPSDIGTLSGLVDLDVSRNKLAALPRCVCWAFLLCLRNALQNSVANRTPDLSGWGQAPPEALANCATATVQVLVQQHRRAERLAVLQRDAQRVDRRANRALHALEPLPPRPQVQPPRGPAR